MYILYVLCGGRLHSAKQSCCHSELMRIPLIVACLVLLRVSSFNCVIKYLKVLSRFSLDLVWLLREVVLSHWAIQHTADFRLCAASSPMLQTLPAAPPVAHISSCTGNGSILQL